mgnify:CR=1 FL=1|jgi:Predicted membrane protein/domain
MIGCNAPVAHPTLRMIAAAIDVSLVLCAMGLFLGAIHLGGGDVAVNDRSVLIAYVVAGILFGTFYKLLFTLSNADTPGIQWTGMRLVDFDGLPPRMPQRLQRLAGGFVSTVAAGLGLLWALVDEETLTWHDHISKTFLTTAPPGSDQTNS